MSEQLVVKRFRVVMNDGREEQREVTVPGGGYSIEWVAGEVGLCDSAGSVAQVWDSVREITDLEVGAVFRSPDY